MEFPSEQTFCVLRIFMIFLSTLVKGSSVIRLRNKVNPTSRSLHPGLQMSLLEFDTRSKPLGHHGRSTVSLCSTQLFRRNQLVNTDATIQFNIGDIYFTTNCHTNFGETWSSFDTYSNKLKIGTKVVKSNKKHKITESILNTFTVKYSNHLNTKHLNTGQLRCPPFKW